MNKIKSMLATYSNQLGEHKLLKLAGLLSGFIVLSILAGQYLPSGIDWHLTYRPAVMAVLSGKSPYSVDIYFAPPWGIIPLFPFALLPEHIGRGFFFTTSLLAFALMGYKLGARPVALFAFILSPMVVHCLLNANIEWLPLLGYFLPAPIGLFFVAIKPQIGIGAAIFWFFKAWRNGGIKQVSRVFGPFIIVCLISFAWFGLWPLRFQDTLAMTQGYNQSFWPLSIPIGIGLLIYANRKHNILPAMAASPCLSPYVLLHAWVGVLAAVLSDTTLTVGAVIGLWIAMGIRYLPAINLH